MSRTEWLIALVVVALLVAVALIWFLAMPRAITPIVP